MNFKIIGKYIKELDFQIPNPKTFFLLSKEISNYKINIDIKSNQLKEKLIEVQTSLGLATSKEGHEKIKTKIVYSSIIELSDNIKDKSEIEKIVLISVPSKVYPEMRKLFILMFENSGFRDIKINQEVNFEELYNRRKIQ